MDEKIVILESDITQYEDTLKNNKDIFFEEWSSIGKKYAEIFYDLELLEKNDIFKHSTINAILIQQIIDYITPIIDKIPETAIEHKLQKDTIAYQIKKKIKTTKQDITTASPYIKTITPDVKPVTPAKPDKSHVKPDKEITKQSKGKVKTHKDVQDKVKEKLIDVQIRIDKNVNCLFNNNLVQVPKYATINVIGFHINKNLYKIIKHVNNYISDKKPSELDLIISGNISLYNILSDAIYNFGLNVDSETKSIYFYNHVNINEILQSVTNIIKSANDFYKSNTILLNSIIFEFNARNKFNKHIISSPSYKDNKAVIL